MARARKDEVGVNREVAVSFTGVVSSGCCNGDLIKQRPGAATIRRQENVDQCRDAGRRTLRVDFQDPSTSSSTSDQRGDGSGAVYRRVGIGYQSNADAWR